MYEELISMFHFFIFLIPGFVTVWSYRFFSNSGKIGDFEYFAASCFWGLMMIAAYEFMCLVASKRESMHNFLDNPYGAGSILCLSLLTLLGFLLGWGGSILAKNDYLRSLISRFRNFKF